MYDGGKGAMYHKIINRIPPHRVYIEPFLGGGAVMKRKRPAAVNIGLDLNRRELEFTAREVLRMQGAPGWALMALEFGSGGWPPAGTVISDGGCPGDEMLAASVENDGVTWAFACGDALAFLERLECRGDEFVYLDPPYLIETRRNGKRIYRHEMSFDDHVRLLEIIRGLDCMVAISGYWSGLYADMLHDWRMDSWTARTRQGVTTERLWMNYPEPTRLHDYRYLGDTYRERDRIKRKKARWVAKLQRMQPRERYALLAALEEAFSDADIS